MGQYTDDVINWMQGTFGDDGNGFFDFFSTWGGPTGWLLVVALVFWLGGSKPPLQVVVGWGLGLLGVLAIVRLERPVVSWCQKRPLRMSVTAAVLAAARPSSMKHRWLNLLLGLPIFVIVIALSIVVESNRRRAHLPRGAGTHLPCCRRRRRSGTCWPSSEANFVID